MEDKVNEKNLENLSVLALNRAQYEWMLGLKAAKVRADVSVEKDEKKALAKAQWLDEWLKIEHNAFKEQYSGDCTVLQTAYDLCQRSAGLVKEDANLTWYYLAVMEAELFAPYGLLYDDEKEKEKNKPFRGLKFHSTDFVKQFVTMDGRISASFIDRVDKTYKEAIARMDGRYTKIAFGALATFAIAAMTAAAAALFAGPIAVGIMGGNFIGLHGIALTNACLAALAGGSLAVGGGGIAGGVATIVGGGALLGLAVGGTASASINVILVTSPKLTLSNAAKLEVTIREILLNVQKDTASAQKVLACYKEELLRLKHLMVDLEEENKKNKKQIDAMKISISYINKSIKSLDSFTSSFEIGLKSEDDTKK